eukprot:2838850-Amphidinium_carterae.1
MSDIWLQHTSLDEHDGKVSQGMGGEFGGSSSMTASRLHHSVPGRQTWCPRDRERRLRLMVGTGAYRKSRARSARKSPRTC